MFEFNKLTKIEKELILIIGNPIKAPPIEPYTNIKDRKRIYKEYFEKSMAEERFEEILDDLYYKGIISFVPTSISAVNNLRENAEEEFKRNHSLELGWKNQDPFVRLTTEGERTITGSHVYNQLIIEDINNKYIRLNKYVKSNISSAKEVKELKNKIDGIMLKNLEIISIFIAIFTLIVSNIGIFTFLEGKSLIEIITLIFIINGVLLLSISFLLLCLDRIILEKEVKLVDRRYRLLIIPVVLIIIGLLIK